MPRRTARTTTGVFVVLTRDGRRGREGRNKTFRFLSVPLSVAFRVTNAREARADPSIRSGYLCAMSPAARRTMLWVSAYAIAMGVLEAAVVIYLRKLYFPGGFRFPMNMIGGDIVVVELWRELATVVMLASIGALAGRTRSERFALFIYAFGLWDLVYYGFLKLTLGWPESVFTWDILFLLPIPWFGPVLAPCLVALTMCGIALTTVGYADRGLDGRM